MSAGPVVSAAARDAVGTVTATYRSDPVSLRQLREYVAATGGRPEEWGDPDDPHAAIVTPPLFFHAVCRRVVAEADLGADGQYSFLGVEGVSGRTMAGGHKYELLEPVKVGDVLSVTERLKDITEKDGRTGPLVFVTTEADYHNHEGTLVARYQQTTIFR
ncbi:MaoC family dehydratase N-terminal domain-containing protein [Rhodococcus sp. NPDC059968]|uniref:FAS1-like dehydratase domain-containing protein n=1 Tax=Rhodococcus sp. NPDC059968 TaxID=3347017 RepID=UPI003670DD9D